MTSMSCMYDCEYVNVRRIVYGEGATFIPVCVQCHRFVKADDTIKFCHEGPPIGTTAVCSKCGPTRMHFEGYI